ncbi:DNA-binding response regulator [Desulfonema ishimotonii]|uniref:DNA-binding response regulator n=1 Tax=Desulfonema ishimotonii TaxID=45657 RepID=A0A401FVY5_9BACT|nr:response regulator [Desulfonema ishimotonii]GBC61119.1 DNA-binding response regulator [Desulfonema ishimotonii]
MAGYLILIIDDDPAQHMILGDYLRLAGYEVIHAENGEEGLTLLEARRPDLVLLDVQMPGMDGFQVIEKIRKNAANRNISVLFITALDRQHLKIKGLEQGADDYITKPFDRAELLARINAVLRRSDRSRHLEGVMEGDLADAGLSDLLQSMELSLKTAVIHLKDMDSEIVIRSGELLAARQGGFTGDEALIRMFLLESGYFSIKFNEIPPGITGSPRSLTSVLMNISNEVDEIRDIIRQLGVGDRRLIIADETAEFPELRKVREIMPATFTEIITAMDGDIRENIRLLVAASKKRKLKVERKS